MKLGCKEIDITPPVPIFLGGYGDRTRPGNNIEVPLKARAFVFDDGKHQLGLITAEIILLSREQVDIVRRRVAGLTGLLFENIIISSSHTHSGPSTRSIGIDMGEAEVDYSGIKLNRPDHEYLDWLQRALAGALMMAYDDLEEVKMGNISEKANGIGKNRHDPTVSVDNKLHILAFARSNDSVKAVIINYACHPTVLSAENLSITSDFPGLAINFVKRQFPKTVIGFLNGAAGDISTRFTRKEQTHQEAARFGLILGGLVLNLMGKIEYQNVKTGSLLSSRVELDVDFKNYPSEVEINEEINKWQNRLRELKLNDGGHSEIRVVTTGLQGARLQKLLAGLLDQLERKAEINVWKIGKVAFVSFPGEMFSELGRQTEERSPFEQTIISGYSNGHLGYIPDERSYEQGGYETLSTPLAAGFGEKLVNAASNELNILMEG